MKIQKYIKQSNGMYKVVLADRIVKLHEDLILKYELLIKKDIDDKLLEQLLKENKNYEVYNLAIKYINKRIRTKNEIVKYLKKYEIAPDKIESTIDLLTSQGYLNDVIYVESFIHDKIVLTNIGPLKIKKMLLDENINEDLINEKLKIYDNNLECERIEKIVNKSIKSNKKSNHNLKIKLKQDLLNLGYNIENIQSILENINIDDEENKKREYDKLYRKYSRKYSGKELEYKITQALYQKGYR